MVCGNILESSTFSTFFLKDIVVLAVIARLRIESNKEKKKNYDCCQRTQKSLQEYCRREFKFVVIEILWEEIENKTKKAYINFTKLCNQRVLQRVD